MRFNRASSADRRKLSDAPERHFPGRTAKVGISARCSSFEGCPHGRAGPSANRQEHCPRRRPTVEEMVKQIAYFLESFAGRPDSINMALVTVFALFSTRRQEEIASILWCDLEQAPRTRILVRDMKHPGQKIGNNVRCDLPEEAMRVIQAMPRVDERIFPYNHRSISSRFTRACKVLGIEDLHFHDLHHEGVSRLFEMGETIPHVAAVSGHRD
jgi:integrase